MRNLCGTIFYIKTNVLQDFHICMSVPLNPIYDTLWTRAGSSLLISKMKDLNLLCLNVPVKLVLLM